MEALFELIAIIRRCSIHKLFLCDGGQTPGANWGGICPREAVFYHIVPACNDLWQVMGWRDKSVQRGAVSLSPTELLVREATRGE